MKQSNKVQPTSFDCRCRASILFALLVFQTCIATATGLTSASVTSVGAEQELLEPERAFLLSVRFKDAKTAEFLYRIADGYYMYRSRFKVVAEPKASATFGKAVFTKGEMKQDATFGRVEIFRNSMRILMPISSIGKDIGAGGGSLLLLKVSSQGCADAGVCYPPLHQTLTLKTGSGDVIYPDSASGIARDIYPNQSGSDAVKPSLSELLRKTK